MTALVDFIERLRALPEPENEAAVEHKVVAVALGHLGWDVTGTDVQFQYTAKRDTRSGGVCDIALLSSPNAGARPAVLIEAKAPRQDLEKHLEQLLNYAFHTSAAQAVLTNGRQWWFCYPRGEGEPLERRFAAVDIHKDDPAASVGVLERFLGATRVRSGTAGAEAQAALEGAHLGEVWGEMLRGPDPELVKLVAERTRRRFGFTPAAERVKETLSAGTAPAPPPAPPPPRPGPWPPAPPGGRRGVRPVSFRLFGEDADGELTWRKIFELTIAALRRKHPEDFRRIMLEAKQHEGSSIPMAFAEKPNRRWFHKVEGLWFCTELNAKNAQRHTDHMLRIFGYDPDEVRKWETTAATRPPG